MRLISDSVMFIRFKITEKQEVRMKTTRDITIKIYKVPSEYKNQSYIIVE